MVSIIAPCRNERHRIDAFINSVLSQRFGSLRWELLVADGVSDDGTREIITRHASIHSEIRLIDNPEMIVSTGLNAAIRAAKGEIILRMDCHTEYHPEYVARCVQVLSETGADNVGGPARTRFEGFYARLLCAAYHNPFSCGGARFHDEHYEGLVDTVPYGCWRKETLDRLGLFDTSLVRNQDDELNLRLIRAGGKIWQSPSIISWYRPRTNVAALFRQYLQYGFWKVAVIRKFRLPASWRHVVPGVFVVANAAIALGITAAFLAGNRDGGMIIAAAWALLLTLYLVLSFLFALRSAGEYGWLVTLLLPFIFAVYHVSYGVGFLLGLLSPRAAHGSVRGKAALFSSITR